MMRRSARGSTEGQVMSVSGVCTSRGRFFFFQAEDGIRDLTVTGVQTCALPIYFRFICWGGLQDLKLWDGTMNKTFPLNVNASERRDGDGSVYSRPCPQCGAPAWCYCVTDTGKRTNGATHKKRNASNPNAHSVLPDNRVWWKEHTRA